MASFESIQRRIDLRFALAQKKMDETALSNQGGTEDMMVFLDASRKMATATFSLTEQTRLKHSLTKSIIDAVQ
ncbi:type III secretion protein HrpF [Pseudomonas deceptionensis]|uniref:HrpF protein n=1 Tax=Pseudomonas deceptionensis TaxID=882211 RepID=A0A0J6GEW4_PSEDM|nr:type III secretion protein HrpF [Pseudomonas deceptionensis]KMM80464.1 type III secretion protein HrpF [Pseudomonas deceptionensis]SEE13933.1 HrpF protein [Pseudomonas deceptionensis]